MTNLPDLCSAATPATAVFVTAVDLVLIEIFITSYELT